MSPPDLALHADRPEGFPPTRSKPQRAWVKPLVKVGLTVLVVLMAGRHVSRTWNELRTTGRNPSFHVGFLALAAALYIVGLAICGFYFGRILKASPTPIGWAGALRGYVISHLGKYVPGKALVVVMRVALVRPFGARPATAAIATFYETLVMMAAGSLVATAGFLANTPGSVVTLPVFGRSIEVSLWLLGAASALCFLIVVEPRNFPRIAGVALSALRQVGRDALPRFSPRLLGEGLALTGLTWICFGLSQVAVLRGLGLVTPWSVWPGVVASVALATVAGFAVPISPGGLGVREWVLWTALGASIDQDLAVVAALTLRLVWFVGEVVASAAVWAIRPPLSSTLDANSRTTAP